jgi:23S rRNA (uracil1939-C5)-methyltransferase
MAREAVRKAGFDPESVEPIILLPAASRRRVELKVENGRMGYYAERSHRLIDIEECKVLEPALEALVLRLKPQLLAQKSLTAVQVNGVDGGYDILLSGNGSEKLELAGEASVVRASVRDGKVTRTLFESAPAIITLGTVKVEVPPGAFLQASREAQAIMTEHVVTALGGAQNILDLFSGIGTYSFPLAANANVTAMEGDAAMVKAMQTVAMKTLKAQRRDLFANPVPAAELNRYDAVVINPPRAGAKEQTAELARSKVKKLVMVSCNPATLTRDARYLKEAGYRLLNAVPIDQFSYSPHLEIIVIYITCSTRDCLLISFPL